MLYNICSSMIVRPFDKLNYLIDVNIPSQSILRRLCASREQPPKRWCLVVQLFSGVPTIMLLYNTIRNDNIIPQLKNIICSLES